MRHEPSSGVVMDQSGNLYGTTIAGGTASCGCGVVDKLSPGANGVWTYTVLHRFTGYDGAEPDANLTLDDKGNILRYHRDRRCGRRRCGVRDLALDFGRLLNKRPVKFRPGVSSRLRRKVTARECS